MTTTRARADSTSDWQDLVSGAFVDLVCTSPDVAFTAELRQIELAGAAVSWVSSGSLVVDREAAVASAYRGHQLLLTIQLEAASAVEQDGRRVRLPRGGAAWYDPARPYRLTFGEAGQHLAVLAVDRRDLPVSDAELLELVAREIPAATPGLPSLTALLRGMAGDVDEVTELFDTSLTKVVPRLAEAVLGEGPDPSGRRRLLDDVKRWARDHLAEPDLRAGHLAAAFFLSERALYALFSESGETPAGWIRTQRCRRGQELLAATSWSVSRIGEECGYPDPAAFARAFRAVTGATPTAYRAACGLAPRT